MNHQGAELQLKNTGTRTCALLGYPGLGLEDAQHKTLTSHVTERGMAPSAAERQGPSP